MTTLTEKLHELSKLDAELSALAAVADQSPEGSLEAEIQKKGEYDRCLAEVHELQRKEAIARDIADGY